MSAPRWSCISAGASTTAPSSATSSTGTAPLATVASPSQRVDELEALAPGDVVFTTGYPDHVFVFHAWHRRRDHVARISDNQGHRHTRALIPPADSDDAGFGFALRAPPAAAPAPGPTDQ